MVVVAYGNGRLRGVFITKFKSQFKRGLRKVLVSRAGRLRDWSQGERRLYYQGRRHLSYIKKDVEDEKHFLTLCPAYQEKKKYFI